MVLKMSNLGLSPHAEDMGILLVYTKLPHFVPYLIKMPFFIFYFALNKNFTYYKVSKREQPPTANQKV